MNDFGAGDSQTTDSEDDANQVHQGNNELLRQDLAHIILAFFKSVPEEETSKYQLPEICSQILPFLVHELNQI